MNTQTKLTFLAAAISSVLLTGCGDAETTIVELPPIEEEHDHDEGEEHNHDEYEIDSAGRLSVTDADSTSI